MKSTWKVLSSYTICICPQGPMVKSAGQESHHNFCTAVSGACIRMKFLPALFGTGRVSYHGCLRLHPAAVYIHVIFSLTGAAMLCSLMSHLSVHSTSHPSSFFYELLYIFVTAAVLSAARDSLPFIGCQGR